MTVYPRVRQFSSMASRFIVSLRPVKETRQRIVRSVRQVLAPVNRAAWHVLVEALAVLGYRAASRHKHDKQENTQTCYRCGSDIPSEHANRICELHNLIP